MLIFRAGRVPPPCVVYIILQLPMVLVLFLEHVLHLNSFSKGEGQSFYLSLLFLKNKIILMPERHILEWHILLPYHSANIYQNCMPTLWTR